MKRTVVLGSFFVFVMMLALGMSPLGMSPQTNQPCCGINCFAPDLTAGLPIGDSLMLCEGMSFSGLGGPPPSRNDSDRKPSTGRRAPKLTGHPTLNVVEQFLGVVEDIDPELSTQLKKICEADPEAFETIIKRLRHRFGSLMQLRCSDPNLFEIKLTELKTDAEIYYLTEHMREMDLDAPDAAAQIAQLHGLVSAKTTLSMSAQQLSIERLERHLQGLQLRLEETKKNFDVIVENRVRVLLDIVQKDKQFALPRLE